MIVAALSLAGIDISSTNGYISGFKKLLTKIKPDVAVLPAHSALTLGLGIGRLNRGHSFIETLKDYIVEGAEWNKEYLNLHSRLSKELHIVLASGSLIEKEEGRCYQTVYCFNPDGQVGCVQHQTHLTRFERDIQISRGESLKLFQIGDFKTGLVVGNDARHPEVGRILALQGADLVLHCGALEGDLTCWKQAAGMWAQVQQNQFFAVEAQLSTDLAGTKFGATLAVAAPCEITARQTGYLARGNPGSPLLCAEIEKETLTAIRKNYPLLKLLNPEAYTAGYGEKPQ